MKYTIYSNVNNKKVDMNIKFNIKLGAIVYADKFNKQFKDYNIKFYVGEEND